jgi:hypothetical protein
MRRLVPAIAALLASGCGYIGAPIPPLANVPETVTKLAAIQRGAALDVRFPIPLLTTEKRPLKQPLKYDVRIGAPGATVQAWEAHAKAVSGVHAENGVAVYEVPAAEWVGKEVAIRARVIGPNGKTGDWSSPVTLPVIPPPQTPQNVTAASTPKGVRLAWTAQGGRFRVFRRAAGETNSVMVATADTPEWTDPNAEFGKQYAYRIETVVPLPEGKEAVSDLSTEAVITPEIVFPPATPTGLAASPAPDSIELTWEANTEPFFAAYRVYRAAANGPFEKIADNLALPAYSDRAVEHGKTYRYAVTSVSKTGYESPRSQPVEATLP